MDRARRAVVAATATVVVLTGCSTAAPSEDTAGVPSSRTASPPNASPEPGPPTEGVTPSGSPTGAPEAQPERRPPPRRIDSGTALAAVTRLAGVIGPRPATSPAYRRASSWVERRLRSFGYVVRRQPVSVPAGVSWGIPVPAGVADNLVATLPGTDLRRRHVVVGAHLDTVPQAPGGEDNASGVGVMLAVAEAVADRRTRLPVAFIAFAAEEPRGPSDDDHHYGSRHYVASLDPVQRRAVHGMVSLDRVGVGLRVPVCAAESPDDAQVQEVQRAARRAGVPVEACVNRSSDHWSFVRDGLPGVRLGGTSYAQYHSADDGPMVPQRGQLARTGRAVLSWLSPS